jgi:hypothetical protein
VNGNKSANHRWFHIDRTICAGHIADAGKSIPIQESGLMLVWYLRYEGLPRRPRSSAGYVTTR